MMQWIDFPFFSRTIQSIMKSIIIEEPYDVLQVDEVEIHSHGKFDIHDIVQYQPDIETGIDQIQVI
jgi:hypothetical protein